MYYCLRLPNIRIVHFSVQVTKWFLSQHLVSQNKQIFHLFLWCLWYRCQWRLLSVLSLFCWFFFPYMSLFYQGSSEMHGVLWQLFKQPRLLSKGRCLHWSESCLFSSRRCFPPQAWAGIKMASYQKHELGNLRRHWRCLTEWCLNVCVCILLRWQNRVRAVITGARCLTLSHLLYFELLEMAENWLVRHAKNLL